MKWFCHKLLVVSYQNDLQYLTTPIHCCFPVFMDVYILYINIHIDQVWGWVLVSYTVRSTYVPCDFYIILQFSLSGLIIHEPFCSVGCLNILDGKLTHKPSLHFSAEHLFVASSLNCSLANICATFLVISEHCARLICYEATCSGSDWPRSPRSWRRK